MEIHFPSMESTASRRARERVLADLKALVDDAEDLLQATAGDAREKVNDARSRLNGALERAKSTCQELQEQSIATARELTKKADVTIRSHPYETIGVAFGLGVVLGVLLRRR